MSLTLAERARVFNTTFPVRAVAGAEVHVYSTKEGDRLHGVWMGGQNFRNKSAMYGAFPPALLPCIVGLFPDARRILHLFSGSLTAGQVEEAWRRVYPSSERHTDDGGRPVASMLEAVRVGGISTGSCRYVEGVGYVATSPLQIRFDHTLHPAAKAAQPDVIGDAERLSELLRFRCEECGDCSTKMNDYPHHREGCLHRGEKYAALAKPFDLVIADPPYAISDQRRYWRESMHALGACVWEGNRCSAPAAWHVPVYRKSTKEGALVSPSTCSARHEFKHPDYVRFRPLKKQRVLEQCAEVVKPGGHVVWVDCIWPQHAKTTWRTVAILGLVRSTTHRIRQITILERQP